MDRRTFVNALALSVSTRALAQALPDNDVPHVSLRTIQRRRTDDPNATHRTVHVIGIGRDGGQLLTDAAGNAFEGNLTLTQVDGFSARRTYTSFPGNAEQVRIGANLAGAQIIFLLGNTAEPTTAYMASLIADAARRTGALTVGLAIPTTIDASDSYVHLLAPAVDAVIALPYRSNMEAPPQRAGALPESEAWATIKSLSQMLLRSPFDRLACMNIREVLKERGRAHIGIGYGIGNQRAITAAAEAIAGQHLTGTRLRHANIVLVIVAGPLDMTAAEAHVATRHIGSCVGVPATLVPSWQNGMHLDGYVRVAVIVAGARRVTTRDATATAPEV